MPVAFPRSRDAEPHRTVSARPDLKRPSPCRRRLRKSNPRRAATAQARLASAESLRGRRYPLGRSLVSLRAYTATG